MEEDDAENDMEDDAKDDMEDDAEYDGHLLDNVLLVLLFHLADTLLAELAGVGGRRGEVHLTGQCAHVVHCVQCVQCTSLYIV